MPAFRRKFNYVSRNNKRQRVSSARWSRARARINNRRRVSTNRGVTVQHDTRQVYSRRRMPKRKRRMWKRFVRKVQWVDEKNLGTRTVLYNVSKTFTNVASGNHGYLALCLYGWQSANTFSTWVNDIKYSCNLENRADQTAANDLTVATNARMFFHSAVLDVTMRNTTTTNGVLDPQATLEVDVYQMTASKEFHIDNVVYENLTDALNIGTPGIYDNNVPALGSAVAISTRGATPFEMTKALSIFGMKVWKKTKYYIASGATITFQIRDPKRHVFYRDKMDGLLNGGNYPGVTKWFFIVFKTVPGFTIGAGVNTTESLTVGVTRKYMYKVEGLSEDRSITVAR